MNRVGKAIVVWVGLLSLSAQAAPTDCTKFREIVFDTIGRVRALNQGGYALTVMSRDGQVHCSEAVQGHRELYPASAIKTLIAITALRLVDAGRLSLDQTVTIDQSNAAVECRDWGCDTYGPGKQMTLRKLLEDMIRVSNNLATNQSIDVVTRPELAETIRLLDLAPMRVVRKVYNIQDPEPDYPGRNMATADSLAKMYAQLAVGGRDLVLSEGNRQLLLGWLATTKYNDRLNREFPQGVVFFHKTGSTSKVSCDAGFYRPNEDTVVVITALQDFVDFAALGRLGRRTFDWLQRELRLESPLDEWPLGQQGAQAVELPARD